MFSLVLFRPPLETSNETNIHSIKDRHMESLVLNIRPERESSVL